MNTKLKLILSLFLVMCLLPLQAQQDEWRAKELLDFVIATQGDSVYVRLNSQLQHQLSPEIFNTTMDNLEGQVGKYRSYSKWESGLVSGLVIYQSAVTFEHATLYFFAAFDSDGRANTIRFAPNRVVYPSATKIDRTKIEERPIEVVCGKYKLPGTLTLPVGVTNVPVVVWVQGSGPNDRDETIGPNKPFRDLAWGMAERGIASIRYDKRTFVYREKYASGGEGTYDDETVDDALAAIILATRIEEVNPNQVYVAGHSLGAMLAPRIAERSEKELAGIIMIAGNARPIEELLVEQVTYLASLPEVPVTQAQVSEMKKQVDNLKRLGTSTFKEIIPLPLGYSRLQWEFSRSYKQVDVAKRLSLPMLILQGERDYQITMEDFRLWRAALSDKPNVAFKSYPVLNHLLQEGEGKSSPAEYDVVGRVPAYFMDDIARWIKEKKV